MDRVEALALIDSGKWRQHIVDDARTWKGTPYQHKGRRKGVGADCGGMIYEIFSPLFGPLKPFPKNYPPDWALHRENEIYLNFIADYVMEVSGPRVGGIAMFKVGRNFSHGAICTDKRSFVHSWGRNQAGGVIESRIGFFQIGNEGKPREVKYYDVDVDKWLFLHR